MEIEGLTGEIRFNEDGRRENYTLSVVEMSSNSDMIKVAEWSDRTRLTPNGKRLERVPPRIDFERNRTYIVTTIIEEPYITVKKAKLGEVIDERDRYEGYCKDLADILAKRLGINCKWIKCGLRMQSPFANRIFLIDYIPIYLAPVILDVLRPVRDQRYGAKNSNEVGGWDGMVGELVRRVRFYQYLLTIVVTFVAFLLSKTPKFSDDKGQTLKLPKSLL